jgi:hypothetical protein
LAIFDCRLSIEENPCCFAGGEIENQPLKVRLGNIKGAIGNRQSNAYA